MGHIHTNPGEHDHTVSAFIIRLDLEEPVLLMHMHKKLGKYLQFWGHVELDETPWDAIAHEVEEESGYRLNQLKILQPKGMLRSLTAGILHPYPVSSMTHAFDETHNHTDVEYAFTVDGPPLGVIQEGESTEFRNFSRSELETSRGDMPENVREIGMFVFDICLKEWEPVDATQFHRTEKHKS